MSTAPGPGRRPAWRVIRSGDQVRRLDERRADDYGFVVEDGAA